MNGDGSQMTLAEKLENFKTMPIGFHVKTEEIACLLGEAMDSVGIKGNAGSNASFTMGIAWNAKGNTEKLYVTMNRPYSPFRLGYGTTNDSGKYLDEIYEVTVEELKEYLGSIGDAMDSCELTCKTCGYHDNFANVCYRVPSGFYGHYTDATDSCDRHTASCERAGAYFRDY